MCDRCKSILIGYKIEHEIYYCPLLKSGYCGICLSYGHSPMTCPDIISMETGQAQNLEQLIPPALLQLYHIRTITPLPNCNKIILKNNSIPIMEVVNSHVDIKSILKLHGVSVSGKNKEDRIRVQRLAESLNRKLIWVDN